MRDCMCTWLASPHVAEDLDVARDLLLCAFYAGLLEVIDEELVAPAAAAARIGSPGRLPVLAKTWGTRRGRDERGGTRVVRRGAAHLRQRSSRRPLTRPRCRP